MAQKNYFRQYNQVCAQYDKLSKKYDKLFQEQANLKAELKASNRLAQQNEKLWLRAENQLAKRDQKCKDLENELKLEKEKVQKLEEQLKQTQNYLEQPQEDVVKLKNELEKEKAKNKRDSNTTSTPTGRDPDTPNKEIKSKSVNTYNGREPSGKKPGGQPGHAYHNLEMRDVEELLKDESVLHKVIEYGTPGTDFEKVVEVDLVCQVIVTEHIIHADYEAQESDPKPPRIDRQVIYGNNLKALAAILSVKYNLSYNKMSQIFAMLTEGKITPSKASTYNWVKLFVEPARKEKLELERKLLQEETIYTDSTVMVVGGKTRNNIRVCASKDGKTVYTALETKEKQEMIEKTILGAFNNTIVSDHESAVLSLGGAHQECLVHILRYLKQNSEETPHLWSHKLSSLLSMLIFLRKNAVQKWQQGEIDKTSFSEDIIRNITENYKEILKEGHKENQADQKAWYYSQELALLKRLERDEENVLYFLTDFHTDPDNNLSERLLRPSKLKQKNSGGFRTFAGLRDYSDILTLVSNHNSHTQLLPDLRNLLIQPE